MKNQVNVSWPVTEEAPGNDHEKYMSLIDATMNLTNRCYSATANRSHERREKKKEERPQ